MLENSRGRKAFQNCPNRKTIVNQDYRGEVRIQCLKYPDSSAGGFTDTDMKHYLSSVANKLGCLACPWKNSTAIYETGFTPAADGTLQEVVVMRPLEQNPIQDGKN